MAGNGLIFGGGRGQYIRKTEGPQSESVLVVRQALIGLGALFVAAVAFVFALLVVGSWIVQVVGAVLIMRIALRIITMQLPHSIRSPATFRAVAIVGGLSVVSFWWFYLGPRVAMRIWPPVGFLSGWLWVGGKPVVRMDLWQRGLALLGSGVVLTFAILLAYRMKQEVLDPNWPPAYDIRDPALGPWDPTRRNLGSMIIDVDAHEEDNVPARMRLEIHKPGGAINYHDLPSRKVMGQIARSVVGARRNWSVRGLASIPGVSKDKAADILNQMEEAELIHYPAGRNDPDGAQLTEAGQKFVNKLINE